MRGALGGIARIYLHIQKVRRRERKAGRGAIYTAPTDLPIALQAAYISRTRGAVRHLALACASRRRPRQGFRIVPLAHVLRRGIGRISTCWAHMLACLPVERNGCRHGRISKRSESCSSTFPHEFLGQLAMCFAPMATALDPSTLGAGGCTSCAADAPATRPARSSAMQRLAACRREWGALGDERVTQERPFDSHRDRCRRKKTAQRTGAGSACCPGNPTGKCPR